MGDPLYASPIVWVLTVAASSVIALVVLSRVSRSPVARRSGARLAGLAVRARPALHLPRISHRGMPSLHGLASRIGSAERIPPKVFYVPLAFHWLWLTTLYRSLSLPALTNPLIEVGGLWGESKRVYLDMVEGDERRWLARYVALTRETGGQEEDVRRALASLCKSGLTFPLVAKPDIGWQGFGVRSIASEAELRAYVSAFPNDETLILQEMIGWEGEAGVFYVRQPEDARGSVISLTLRYFPFVIGDGEHSIRDLIHADKRASWKSRLHLGHQHDHGGVPSERLEEIPPAGETVRLSFIASIRVGGLYRDADAVITPKLSARFDAIARSIPEFHYGRFDIRFASLERLQVGEDFRIIEINGAGSESISAWDPEKTVWQVYSRLAAHQTLMFEIGAKNRARGWKSASPLGIAHAAWRQTRLIRCYPPSS